MDGYKQIANLLPEPTLLTSASGEVLFVNAAAKALGLPWRDATPGIFLSDLIADPPDRLQRYLQQCARSRQMMPGSFRWHTRDQEEPLELRCDGALLQPAQEGQEAVLMLRMRPQREAASRFLALNEKVDDLSREIMRRQRVEQALRDSQARLDALFNSANDAILLCEIDERGYPGRLIEVNDAACRLTGHSREALVGMPLRDLVAPEIDLVPRFDQLRESDLLAESVYLTPQGERIPVEIHAHRFELGGRPVALAVARDITRRKEAEEARRQTEERLHFILETAHVGTWDWDMRTNEAHWSDNLEEIHGLEPGTYNGTFESFLQGVHPDDHAKVSQALQRSVEQGEAFRIEYRCAAPDGRERWVEGIGRVVDDQAGRPVRMAGISMDITARKEVEQALRRSEAEFSSTFHQVAVGMVRLTHDNRFLLVNDRFCELTGYTREELAKTTIVALTHPDDRDHVRDMVEQLRSGGRSTFHLEKRLVRKDGRLIWVRVTVTVIRDEAGRPNHRASVFEDITEQKRAQRALRFLAEASTTLAQSLDYQTTLSQVASLMVPGLADWCAIDLVEREGTVEKVTVAHADPEKTRFAQELRRQYPPNPAATTGPPNVMRTGVSEVYPEVPDELLVQAAQDEDHLRILRELKLHSALIVPLEARGRALGALTLISETPGRYSEKDLPLVEELARRCALAVDNARLYQEAQQEIAERQRAEESLQVSEERLRLILESATDFAIFTMDLDRRVTSWNTGAERLLGFDEQEMLDKRGDLIFTEEDRRRGAPRQEMSQALATGRATDERWHERKDGSRFWSSGMMMLLRNPDGSVRGFLKILRDMTDRRRAELRLAAEHAVARVLASAESLDEAAPMLLQAVCGSLEAKIGELWILDPEAQVLRRRGWITAEHEAPANVRKFEEASRDRVFSHGEGLPGRVWAANQPVWITDLSQDLDFPRAQAAIASGLHSGLAFPVHVEGEFFGAMEFFTAQRTEPDQAMLEVMASIGSEIGQFIQRRRAMQAIRSSEARKSAILTSALDCIITMDDQGRIVDFNPAAEQTFGYSHDEVVGQPLVDKLIPPRLRQAHNRGLARFMATGEGPILNQRVEMHAMRADGSEFPMELTISATRLGDGQPFFTGYLRDITERKRNEEQLLRTNQRLAMLSQTAQRLLRTQEPLELINALFEQLADQLGLEVYANYLVTEDGRHLRLTAYAGIPEEKVPAIEWLAVGQTVCGQVARNHGPNVVEDVQHSSDPQVAMIRDLGIQAYVCHPLLTDDRLIGTLSFGTRQRTRFEPEEIDLLQTISRQVAIAIDRWQAEARLRQLNETLEERVTLRTAEAETRATQLRALAAELTQTEQRERRRLAQILHDHLQQILVAARMQVSGARSRADDRMVNTLSRIETLLDEAISESRSLTAELSPPILHSAGLSSALQWLARWMAEKHDLQVALNVESQAEPAENIRVLLFQAVRELLFNVVKHAGVGQAEVTVAQDAPGQLRVVVADRGAGFDPDAPRSTPMTGGFGLFSIRERLELLGGSLEVQSQVGQGTQMILRVPLGTDD